MTTSFERRPGFSVHHSSPAKSGPPNDPPKPAAGRKPAPRWMHTLWIVGLIFTLLLLFAPSTKPNTTSLAYSDWKSKIIANQVDTAVIDQSGKVTGQLLDKNKTHYQSRIPTVLTDNSLAGDLIAHHVKTSGTASSTSLLSILVGLLPLLLLVGVFFFISRRASRQIAGGIGGIGASKAKVYDQQRPKTRFSDVAGYDGAKREISEVVDFLKHADRYARAGAVIPRGVLMVGPPGTGKTLLARAVAGEAEVPFFALTGSSFVELFVGVGAARVRDLFAAARKAAPAIVFIDEIDAIGQRRGTGFVSNDEREQTLNQLLAEMDGFDPTSGIVVLAATNRPETLDPALLRPGRFDRQVEIPLPNLRERAAILAVHAKDKHLADDVDLDAIARATPGFSGADLANLLNEAAIIAVRNDRDIITAADFSEARDRILLGRREATNALLPGEKHAVAVHESGHALVAALSPEADPVSKVTILPAGQALGVTEQLPADERHLYSESYLKTSLAVRLGGRAAELLVLGQASSGAASDLVGATDLATRMVREFGMSARLGPIGFASGSSMYLGTEQVRSRDYAEATQQIIDEEVSALLKEAEQRALSLLGDHRDAIDRLVEDLVAHEIVDGAAVAAALAGTTGATEPAESGGPLRAPQLQARSTPRTP
ncbi:MAG: cell division protease FtsH [Actinomycetota bacterium]|nr:cell division protease FtsH [Actinomycetota bacterium]MDQ1478604.1 cell division protease FtsH [Actinomycetota bacterium]